MKVATIYIPVAGTMISQIVAPGSAIVAMPPTAAQHVIAYYEGNIHGASNLVDYADRIKCAAGRLFDRAPTSAIHGMMKDELPDNLQEVGTIDENYVITFTDEASALAYGSSTPGSRASGACGIRVNRQNGS